MHHQDAPSKSNQTVVTLNIDVTLKRTIEYNQELRSGTLCVEILASVDVEIWIVETVGSLLISCSRVLIENHLGVLFTLEIYSRNQSSALITR